MKPLLIATLALLALSLVLTACSSGIRRSVVVDASIDRTWQVFGDEFADVDAWAASIPESSATYGADGIPTARTCASPIGTLVETVREFDPEARVIAYDAQSDAMPFFVDGLSNRWELTAESPETTRIDMQFEADVWPVIGTLAWPLMRIRMASLLDETIEELEHYVETGRPHERKIAATAEVTKPD